MANKQTNRIKVVLADKLEDKQMAKAKPFIKWVGGKGQLLEQLEALLPADFDNWDNATYIEPFVGGGAMLFNMLQKHPIQNNYQPHRYHA